ncbi:MAG: sulfotransferase domain-containing protein [Anaerolineales bacterium]|nr:sulfotransferase domain-containing protein [Anaerolineales bacterium]
MTNLTIFHITHWKAGSQWIAEILKNCAPERFVPMAIANPHGMGGRGILNFYVYPVNPGNIYGTVYLTQSQFRSIIYDPFWQTKEPEGYYFRRAVINWWNYRIKKNTCRSFVVIRDLRDTLISLYFSAKFSHKIITDQLAELRQKLNDLDEEDGIMYMLTDVLPSSANIQASWIGTPDVLMLKYDDILGNEFAFFENLIDYCEINVEKGRLHEIVRYNIFEAATGRKPGQEDVNAHLRKGIAGDWKNYFSDKIKTEFKKNYGELLIRTGYETSLNW